MNKTSPLGQLKFIAIVIVTMVSCGLFCHNSRAQGFQKKGNVVTYKGNRFELSKPKMDTIILTDPVTNDEVRKYIIIDPHVVKMNGKTLVNHENLDRQPEFAGNDASLRIFLIKNLKKELAKLEAGNYRIDLSDIWIDQNGKVVYFNYDSVRSSEPNGGNSKKARIDYGLQKEIAKKTLVLIEGAPKFLPGLSAGKKVVSEYDGGFGYPFKVIDHKVYEINKDGSTMEL